MRGAASTTAHGVCVHPSRCFCGIREQSGAVWARFAETRKGRFVVEIILTSDKIHARSVG